jgi:PIN domain nuclease of toxin-antitoxin system
LARFLIDSHVFFWAIDAPERLRLAERHLLEDATADVAVSVASFWELSIKLAKGALALAPGKGPRAGDHFERHARLAGFGILPILAPEAEHVRVLPRIHGDPFDRILIAQALLGARTVVTRDAVFSSYPGVRLFVP